MRAPSFTFGAPVTPEIDEVDLTDVSSSAAARVQPGVIVCGNERWLVESRCHTPQLCSLAGSPPLVDPSSKDWQLLRDDNRCATTCPCTGPTTRRLSKTTPITCVDSTTVAVEPAANCKSSVKTATPTAIASITTLHTHNARVQPVGMQSPMPPDYFPDAGDTWIAGFYKHMRVWSRAQFDIEAGATDKTIDEARRRALRASRRMMLYLDRAVEESVTERQEELGLCWGECGPAVAAGPSHSPSSKERSKEVGECDDSCCACTE